MENTQQQEASKGRNHKGNGRKADQFELAQKITEATTPEKTPEDLAREEFESLSSTEKEKVGLGLHNIGYLVEEKKNQLFAKGFDRARQLGLSKGWLRENGSFDRWLLSFGENMTKNAEVSHKKMEDANRTSATQIANIGAVTGNALKYGRVLTDLFGSTLGSPLRYVMMGGMLFGEGAKAAKEARYKNEEVLEKTRVQDINAAADEAWRIYEQAKGDKESISKEDLEKAYLDNAPQDLLNRLKKDPEPGTASSILQKIIRKDVELSVESINKKLTIIEEDYRLTEVDKKIEREKLLQKYSQHIKDLDRAVSQFGAVDELALGAKYGESAAKAVVAGMMVETLVLSIDKLWEKLPSLFGGMVSNASAAEMVSTSKTEDAPAVCTISDYEALDTEADAEILDLATIHKGEGITHALSRQLMNNPEDFGFNGDTNDASALKKWAIAESYNIAVKAGYVDTETGKEIRVGTSGVDRAAYVLGKDSTGNLKIVEQLKGDDGKFEIQETRDVVKHIEDAKFENASKEVYEYEQSGVSTSKESIIKTPEQPAQDVSASETTKANFLFGKTGFGGGFEYSKDGEVSAFVLKEIASTKDNDKLLNEGWEESVLSHSDDDKFSNNIDTVKGDAASILKYEQALNILEKNGAGEGPEAEFLRDRIENLITKNENSFGDVFKNIEEIREPKDVLMAGSGTVAKLPEIMPSDPIVLEHASKEVHGHINSLFGSKGFLGFGVKDGMQSINWKDPEVGFGNKTVSEIMNAKPTAFPGDNGQRFGIENYEATEKMKNYLLTATKESGVPPKPTETAEAYLNRVTSISISKLMNSEGAEVEPILATPKVAQVIAVEPSKITGVTEPRPGFDKKGVIAKTVRDMLGVKTPENTESVLSGVSVGGSSAQEASVSSAPKTDRFETSEISSLSENSTGNEVNKIVTETTHDRDKTTERTGVETTISGSTGREFLSEDFGSKLVKSGAGLDFDRQMAMATSRDISARLIAYNELLAAGKTEDASKHLSALYATVDMADKSLGEGVIDRSKIPPLK